MHALRLLAVGAVACLLATGARADEKKGDNAKLIVGTWEVTSAHPGGPPKGGTVEFTKDGKIKVTGEHDGQKEEFEGTYKLDGNKLVLKFKIGDDERPVDLTIDKLDDTTFVTTSTQGKVELKRMDYAKLILGKWEVTKSFDNGPPVSSTVEFTKDGKLTITHKEGDQTRTAEGTYKLNGDSFHIELKVGDQEHKDTITIKKLDKAKFSTTNKEGQVVELKRAK